MSKTIKRFRKIAAKNFPGEFYDRDKDMLEKTIDGLERMKLTLPMLEAHRDTIVSALVLLYKLMYVA